ncbi:hypothetical protein [Thermophilibacter provencensis]|uniref:hypothetical protein n=1 Tax=Thermophilibacter provencensis TaxID=1852386 RepID=UPI0038B5779E
MLAVKSAANARALSSARRLISGTSSPTRASTVVPSSFAMTLRLTMSGSVLLRSQFETVWRLT